MADDQGWGETGYRTGHFGKWHLGAVKETSPLNPPRMGFDEYLAHDNFFEMNPPLSRNGAPPEIIPGESSELIADEAVRFVRKVHTDPKETTDIAAQHPDIVERMQNELHAWQRSVERSLSGVDY